MGLRRRWQIVGRGMRWWGPWIASAMVATFVACDHGTKPDWDHASSRVDGPLDKDLFECATLDGQVACRGWNPQGVLGRGFFDQRAGKDMEKRLDWGVVKGLEHVSAIAMPIDAHSMCALQADGSVMCWGSNVWGQLGQGWVPDKLETHDAKRARAVPGKVEGLPAIATLAAGLFRFCGIDRAGGVWCWGNNESHPIENTARMEIPRPVKIVGIPPVAKLRTCFFQNCAIGTDSSLWCWGSVRRFPDRIERLDVPTKVVDHDVADVVCHTTPDASSPTCAISKSGQQTCWDTDPDVVHSHR